MQTMVPSGQDSAAQHRGLGVSVISFKLVPESESDPLILENIFHAKGGPPKHFHHSQDEWFHCVEGSFRIEIGNRKYTLQPGDSVLAPKGIPHVWAFVGEGTGRILIAFFPAGKMVPFFEEVTKANAMPPQTPELWRTHGMELVGPPMPIASV
jgi:quercetin dioxygenase-like cupin family protein